MRTIRLILVVLVLFATGRTIQGQTVLSNHLQFKGIALDGDVDTFIQKLIEEGYYLSSNQESANQIRLFGSFIDEPSTIQVFFTPTSRTVFRVDVLQINLDKSALEKSFLDVKGFYSQKYGSPDIILDVCFWEVPFGGLCIMLDEENSAVRITYEDSDNSDKNQEERAMIKQERTKRALDEI